MNRIYYENDVYYFFIDLSDCGSIKTMTNLWELKAQKKEPPHDEFLISYSLFDDFYDAKKALDIEAEKRKWRVV